MVTTVKSPAKTPAQGGLIRIRRPESPPARLLHQIRTGAASTRTELREQLGYSRPSVTRHVRTLIEAGLLEERATSHGASDVERAGRPSGQLVPDGRHRVAWGAHVGLRSTTVVLVDVSGRLIREETLGLHLASLAPGEALARVAAQMRRLGAGLPPPVGVGVAFSAHLSPEGVISSPVSGWDGMRPGIVLAQLLGTPVHVSSGVAAMAGRELLAAPLPATPEGGSVFYFYARELVNHAWIVNGAVHQPHTGTTTRLFREVVGDGPVSRVAAREHGMHPLGDSAVVHAARAQGLAVTDITRMVRAAASVPQARQILDERVRLLADAILHALDVVDPQALVLAGDTFHRDREGLRLLLAIIRRERGAGLQIRLAAPHVTRDAAVLVALHQYWHNPLVPDP